MNHPLFEAARPFSDTPERGRRVLDVSRDGTTHNSCQCTVVRYVHLYGVPDTKRWMYAPAGMEAADFSCSRCDAGAEARS